jgi:hypothetical protein
LSVRLKDRFGEKKFPVHRIIAEQYIPNPNGYRYVKHFDGINSNNSIENLYWSKSSARKKENVRFSTDEVDDVWSE